MPDYNLRTMKRITTTLAISAALALSACKGGGGAAAATKYIPDAAEFVGGMSVSGMISASGQKAEIEEQINKDAEAKEGIEAAKACNLDPWNLDQIVMGGTSKEEFAAVIVGAGFGKADNLTCISGKIKEKKGGDKEPITIEGNKATFDGGDGFGYLVDDNTLVIVSKGWDASVKGLVDGTGTNAFDGSLKDATGLTDMGKHIWFAGKVPAEAAGALGPAAGLSMGGGSMDFAGGGLAVAMAGKFADAAGATKAADEANKAFEQGKAMAGMFGIPQGVVDSVKIAAEGEKITASAKATKEELATLEAKMKEMGGM
jgi:hypothetical protein